MITEEDARLWLDSNYSRDQLAHYGVLGMRWGVRKDRSLTHKKGSEYEKTQRKKRLLIGAAMVAAVLATSAAVFVVRDRHLLSKSKSIMSVADLNLKNIKKSPAGDQSISRGTEFVRRTLEQNGWGNNPLRTYVADNTKLGNDLVKQYAGKTHIFRATQDVKIAGLDTQFRLLSSELSEILKNTTLKEQARFAPATKRYIQGLTNDKFATYTLENLRRSAWGGGKSPSQIANVYAQLLKSQGYSALNDLNLPETSAKVIIDKLVFNLI